MRLNPRVVRYGKRRPIRRLISIIQARGDYRLDQDVALKVCEMAGFWIYF